MQHSTQSPRSEPLARGPHFRVDGPCQRGLEALAGSTTYLTRSQEGTRDGSSPTAPASPEPGEQGQESPSRKAGGSGAGEKRQSPQRGTRTPPDERENSRGARDAPGRSDKLAAVTPEKSDQETFSQVMDRDQTPSLQRNSLAGQDTDQAPMFMENAHARSGCPGSGSRSAQGVQGV